MRSDKFFGDVSDSPDASLPWDQRSTLCPPPYKGAMAKNVSGLTIGDVLVDQLPSSVVCPCHNGPKKYISASRQLQEPPWVDFKQVARGQALWDRHVARAFVSLSCALINGFSIARFAKVVQQHDHCLEHSKFPKQTRSNPINLPKGSLPCWLRSKSQNCVREIFRHGLLRFRLVHVPTG